MEEKIFYKFKNIDDYTFDSLSKRYFYFSTPSLLNDPVDYRIPVSYEAIDSDLKKWIKHLCAQADYAKRVPNVFTMKTYSNFEGINFFEAKPGCKNIKAAIHPIDKNVLEAL